MVGVINLVSLMLLLLLLARRFLCCGALLLLKPGGADIFCPLLSFGDLASVRAAGLCGPALLKLLELKN